MENFKYTSELQGQLITYAKGLGCSADEAADLVQDVMLKAIEKELLEYRNTSNLPYLKTMAKNRFIDQRRQKLTLLEDANIRQKADYQPDEGRDKALLEQIGDLIDNHKYGYIIHEMQKRGVHKIKDLAPYTNEKAQTLYKRYQKLVKDLKKEIRRGGGWPLKTCFEGILSMLILILISVIVLRVNQKPNVMKFLGMSFTIFTLLFMGCSEQNKNVTNPKGAEPERQSSKKVETSYETFQQVKDDLERAGAVEVDKPSDFSPSFKGYDSVKHYSKPSESKIYHVYIFEGPNSEDYQNAAGYCPLDWGSTGLCGDSGDDCRFEDTDGDGDQEVVCCGDDA